MELSHIVPQQEEVTKKEQTVVILGESKMLISNLCIELDWLERKTQMIINLLTSTEKYWGARNMILTCSSEEANTEKEQSLSEIVMRKNAMNLDCGTLTTDFSTDYADYNTLSTNIEYIFFPKNVQLMVYIKLFG